VKLKIFRGHKRNVKIKVKYYDIVERHFYVDTEEVRFRIIKG
jgi:hypothetical protein